MEVVIQIFPDDFHLASLEQILATCGQLQPGVDVKTIIISLIDRLAHYATKSPDTIPHSVDIFNTFFVHVGKVIEQRPNMEVQDVLSLQVSLLNLSLKCYPDKLPYVDEVLGYCGQFLDALKSKERAADYGKPSAVKQIVNLLTTPLENYKNIITVLKLEHYQKLITFLAHATRKKIAIDIVKNVIEYNTVIPEPEQAEKLVECIQPLIRDEPDQADPEDIDKEDFEEEQNLVASLVNLFDNEDPGKLYKIYLTVRKSLATGGSSRIKHTFVPLAFRSLRLVTKIHDQRANGVLSLDDDDWSKIGKKIFQFAHETITQLAKNKLSEVALRLFLQSAQAASYCSFETIAYELVTQAFIIYEEDISDSKTQFNAITLFIGTLQTLTCFSDDNYDTLVTKTAQQSAKLLKKPDQTRAVASCSHLFWAQNEHKDGKRVLECLQKSLKIAGLSMDATTSACLFVEILNEYLYYFENRNTEVPAKHITGLIELINTNIANMDSSASESTSINTFYQNTLKYIQVRKETSPAFQDIDLKN
jgi:vacuolar protein sorting-associated protein 35